MKATLPLLISLLFTYAQVFAERPVNPITNGLNNYGIKDPHVLYDQEKKCWYLVATEVPGPEEAHKGITLYQSDDLQNWSTVRTILPISTVFTTAWYRDEWNAPELHNFNGKWWLTFNCRNNAFKPYGKLGAGLAVSDSIDGPFEVLTPEKPIVEGNHFNLIQTHDHRTFACWELDGQIFGAYIDLDTATLTSQPKELWTERPERSSHRLHVAPHISFRDGRYFLFYSKFYKGYNIHYAVADKPEGPWKQIESDAVFSWKEHDAPTQLRNPFPGEKTFAPPTEIIGGVQVLKGPEGREWVAYHSPDKYAEPLLCVDPIELNTDGSIEFRGRTWMGDMVKSTPQLTFVENIPTTIPISPNYKVEILNDEEQGPENIPAYWAEAAWKTNRCEDTSWASFEWTQPTKIRITRLHGEPSIDFCKVLPYRHGIEVLKTSPNTVEFTIPHTGQYSVEFEKGIEIQNPLLIFADPPEKPLDPKNTEIIRFGPGLHELDSPIKLTSNQTLYLERGAWVRGQVYSDGGSNIQVRGRGVLDGIRYAAREANHMVTLRNVNHALVEGITIVNGPRYNIAMGGEHHHVDNVKMMGWWFSTDGVSTGDHSLVENCFFKVNDDAVKLYRSNTEVRNCVIWQMENGAPFMISWNMNDIRSNFHVHDIDIIRVEHHWDNPNLAIVTAIHGSSGTMSDYLFENITVDNSEWRPFHLITRPNHFGSWDPEQGSIRNFTFRNFHFNGQPRIPSLIKGHDSKHLVENITFENFTINGKTLDTFRTDFFTIDPETTRNIQLLP